MNTNSISQSCMRAALAVVLAGFGAVAGAQSVKVDKPLALRGVMEKLGQNMQAVAGAIAVEDWKLVAELAPKIADHEKPPAEELKQIMGWLGDDLGKFKGFDVQVHKTSTAMGEAAQKGDGQAVIAEYARVQQACLACHQGFRQQFVKKFYGTP